MKESWIAAIFAVAALAGILFFLPFTLGTRPIPAPRNSCIANLVQIDGAKRVWMVDHQKTTNDIPTDSDIFGTNLYIKIKPQCSMGGIYTLGSLNEPPKCSIPGHTLP